MVCLTIYRCLSIDIKKSLMTDLLIGVIRSERKNKMYSVNHISLK
jgi:hypothetical protein